MLLIYTTRTDGFKPGEQYRNPRFFDRVEPKVTAVQVEGDYPHIEAAYRKVGADVIPLKAVTADVPATKTKATKATKAEAEQAEAKPEE